MQTEIVEFIERCGGLGKAAKELKVTTRTLQNYRSGKVPERVLDHVRILMSRRRKTRD